MNKVISSLTCSARKQPPRIDRILLSRNEFYGLFQYISVMFLQWLGAIISLHIVGLWIMELSSPCKKKKGKKYKEGRLTTSQ